MSETPYRFPVEIRVKKRKHGAERRFEVLDGDSDAPFTDTREWRLKTIEIGNDLRDRLNESEYEETQLVGYIEVDHETLEWSFSSG